MEESVSSANQTSEENDPNLVRSLEQPAGPFMNKTLIILILAAIVLGIGSGYIFSRKGGLPGTSNLKQEVTSSAKKGDTFGSSDSATFKDTTEGVLKNGGIDGEGQFHLERPGGVSQNVYLTSSLVDLSKLLNKKVKVWGQTQKAQHAGWLMDVGKIEVL